MKFNSKWLTLLGCGVVIMAVAGCATNSEKEPVSAQKKQGAVADANAKPQAISSVLPAGAVTPNPYLQTKTKVSEQVENNFVAATELMRQKKWPQAEAMLQTLAVTNPTLSGVHLNLGIVYRAEGDTVKAVESFNRAVVANAKNVDAYNQLAQLKREAGDFIAAEALYQKALTVWPFHAESHKNIAILYELYMGKPAQALPHYLAYQQLLAAPDKQVDSWIADLQRRLNGDKKTAAGSS